MNLLKNNWCVRYTGKEDRLIQWLNNFEGASIHGIDNGKYYYGVKYKKPNYKFLPNLSLEPWGKILTYEQFLKYSNMDNNELTIKKDKVLEAAETCPDSKVVLKKLFPEVFKNHDLDCRLAWGDVFAEVNGDSYCLITSCKRSLEPIVVSSCNRLVNIDLNERKMTRQELIDISYIPFTYIGNVFQDDLDIDIKIK